jgi:hypothetical protein
MIFQSPGHHVIDSHVGKEHHDLDININISGEEKYLRNSPAYHYKGEASQLQVNEGIQVK